MNLKGNKTTLGISDIETLIKQNRSLKLQEMSSPGSTNPLKESVENDKIIEQIKSNECRH